MKNTLILALIAIACVTSLRAQDYRTYEQVRYYNYVEGEVPIAETRTYFDDFERPTQSLSKLYTDSKVAVSQQLYDLRGNPGLSTLPAMQSGTDLTFREGFLLKTDGTAYTAADFDGSQLNTPALLGDQTGSLGAYYGDANTEEPYLPRIDFPFQRSWTEPSPDPREARQALPGNTFTMGSGRELKTKVEPIDSDDITELNHYYGLRSHFVNSLQIVKATKGYKTISTSPEGKESIVFSDVDGKQLASAQLVDGVYSYWSYVYYDDLGRVVAEVAPNGVAASRDAIDDTAYPDFVTTYTYNTRDWMVSVSSPDEGISEFVYSDDGKLRFSQSELQRTDPTPRFSYTLYDENQRLIESGEYITGAGYVFENHADSDPLDANSIHAIVNHNGDQGDLDENNKQWVSYVTYDLQEADFLADTDHPYQDFTEGQVTSTENENTKTWYSYDELGRLTFQIMEIKSMSRFFSIDYTYDFIGNLLEVAYQKGVPEEAFYYHYKYDDDQRLSQVYTSIDGDDQGSGAWLHATYYYYPHGPLKRVELATDLQGIDYMYTAEGALKSINALDTQYDPGQDGEDNGFHEDLIGIQYDYYPGDFERQNVPINAPALDEDLIPPSYDGNIRAMTWGRTAYKDPIPVSDTIILNQYNISESIQGARGLLILKPGFQASGEDGFRGYINPEPMMPAPLDEVKTYAYKYDDRNQLEYAVYGEDGEIDQVTTTKDVDNLSYDDNGNLQHLTRYDTGTTNNAVLHELGYTMVSGKNQLESVSGYASYEYDSIGQMIYASYEDGLTPDMYLTYDVSGNVTGIYSDASHTTAQVTFKYDDRGYRLMKKNHMTGYETWYVRDASANVLHYYYVVQGTLVQGGYPLYGAGRLGMAFRYPDHLKYAYELTDHQGNVRQVVSKLKFMATATMEDTEPNKHWEEDIVKFANMDTRQQDQILNTTEDGSYMSWLNPALNSKAIGPAKELDVTYGDKVTMTVNAAYLIPSTDNTFATDVGALLAGGFGFDPLDMETARFYNAINDAFVGGLAGVPNPTNPRQPKAYLQFLFFDRDLNYIPPTDGQVNYAMVPESAGNTSQDLISNATVKHEQVTLEFTVPQDGYMYIYVANESTNDASVYFDDLTIQHLGIKVLQANDYYPFGLPFADNYFKEAYRHGYQGQYAEKDEETGWNAFELRMYDPIIARWMRPDPYGQFASPYLAMANNPAAIDPDGGCVGGLPCNKIVSTGFEVVGSGADLAFIPLEAAQLAGLLETGSNAASIMQGISSVTTSIDAVGSVLSSKGTLINLSQQVYGLGNDLSLRGPLYHDPNMTDLTSTRSNPEIAYRRHERLANTRSQMSPLGRSISNSMKPLDKSLQITKRIAAGQKSLGMPNSGISGMMSGANVLRGAGIVGLGYAVHGSATNIVNSGYSTQAIVDEAGGWAGAYMMGTMGAAYGSALGPVGTLVGGVVGGAAGYYLGSGQIFRNP